MQISPGRAQAIENVALALAAAGARPQDVVKTTFYVVGFEPSMFEQFAQGATAARRRHAFPEAPVTLIGVASLFTPEMLVEIEAVAVTD